MKSAKSNETWLKELINMNTDLRKKQKVILRKTSLGQGIIQLFEKL